MGGRYEHLVNLLTKILNQRPDDPLAILEFLNRTTQWEWFHPKLDTLRDDPEMQATYEMAEKQKALFLRGGGSGEGEQEMEEEVVSGNLGRGAPRDRWGPGLTPWPVLRPGTETTSTEGAPNTKAWSFSSRTGSQGAEERRPPGDGGWSLP